MCFIGCITRPPISIGEALPSPNITAARNGYELTYFCPEGYATRNGERNITLKCNVTEWIELQNTTAFECLEGIAFYYLAY